MNPVNVTGYDRAERAAWAAEESMSTEQVEITIRRTGETVEVLQGDRTTGQLCMGEVIEQVIRLIYADAKPRGPYLMLTPSEWEGRWNKTTNAPEGTAK